MTDKILGSLDYFIDAKLLGRAVANHSFFYWLMKTNLIDHYHIFLGGENDVDTTYKSPGFFDIPNKDKIKLNSRIQLPDYLTKHNYLAFHQNSYVSNIGQLQFLRNYYCKENPFPITSVTHSISYPRHAISMFYQMLNSAMPYDAIICTSDCGKKALEKMFNQLSAQFKDSMGVNLKYNGQLVQIPLGVDITLHKPGNKIKARESLNILDDDFVFLSLGRFSQYDKMDLFPLVNCFKEFCIHKSSNNTNYKLILAGGSGNLDYAEMVKNYATSLDIAEKITILKDINDDEKTALYDCADVFISLSDNIQETFGLTILESMAHGLPVIASGIDGYNELVENGKTGILVPTIWADVMNGDIGAISPIAYEWQWHLQIAQSIAPDPQALIQAMIDLSDNEKLRKQMSINGLKRIDENYSWDKIIKQYYNLWNELKTASSKIDVSKYTNCDKDPFNWDFYDIFNHYTTYNLDSNWSAELSSKGETVYRNPSKIITYKELSHLIEPTTLRQLLFFCRKPIKIDELETRMHLKGIKKWKTRYLVLWCFKYSYIILNKN